MKRIETSRETWVGFASSPRSRAGALIERLEFQLTAPGKIAQHLQRFISAPGLESWLVLPIKFDARLGAKLKFHLLPADIQQQDDDLAFGGTFTALVIPKQIVITTERHGEISIALSEKSDSTAIAIRFSSSLLSDEVAEWQRLANSALARLRAAIDADQETKGLA